MELRLRPSARRIIERAMSVSGLGAADLLYEGARKSGGAREHGARRRRPRRLPPAHAKPAHAGKKTHRGAQTPP